MSDLEFISSISNTFIDEINKFISTFTTTIKNQFEEVDNKVIAQTNEINKLRDELNSKKFDEKNYNTVSVIKNQDKQIYELNNTIKTLENRVKFLEGKTIKESSTIHSTTKTNNTTLEIIEETTSDDLLELPTPPSPPPVLPKSTSVLTTPSSIIEKSRVIEEPKIEEQISITPITPGKKIVAKKNSKKVKEEVKEEVIDEVKEVIVEVSEKPKRKIAVKKNNKNVEEKIEEP